MNPSELQTELINDSRVGVIESDLPKEYTHEGAASFHITINLERHRDDVVSDYEAESERITVEPDEDAEDWVYQVTLSE